MGKVQVIYEDLKGSQTPLGNASDALEKIAKDVLQLASSLESAGAGHENCFGEISKKLEELNENNISPWIEEINSLIASLTAVVAVFTDAEGNIISNLNKINNDSLGQAIEGATGQDIPDDETFDIGLYKNKSDYDSGTEYQGEDKPDPKPEDTTIIPDYTHSQPVVSTPSGPSSVGTLSGVAGTAASTASSAVSEGKKDDKDDKKINIDTDGDGKPDLNIDTDGDKKADLNIDTDGDKKADLNIDTDGDKKADLNIDTDGDKKANLNIDTDGDKKADLNIDTNGDGKPDKNIDADGDGKVDTKQTGDDNNNDNDNDNNSDNETDNNNNERKAEDENITDDAAKKEPTVILKQVLSEKPAAHGVGTASAGVIASEVTGTTTPTAPTTPVETLPEEPIPEEPTPEEPTPEDPTPEDPTTEEPTPEPESGTHTTVPIDTDIPKKNSSGSSVIPLIAGIAAAGAAGIGTKMYLDRKANNDNDEDSLDEEEEYDYSGDYEVENNSDSYLDNTDDISYSAIKEADEAMEKETSEALEDAEEPQESYKAVSFDDLSETH